MPRSPIEEIYHRLLAAHGPAILRLTAGLQMRASPAAITLQKEVSKNIDPGAARSRMVANAYDGKHHGVCLSWALLQLALLYINC